MGKRSVRIEKICIENFKNIRKGELDFSNKRKAYKSSILGLYGQNGSGKTALVDAIHVLKYTLSGQTLQDEYADYINIDSSYATLSFEFRVTIDEFIYGVWYQFSLKKLEYDEDTNFQEKAAEKVKYKVEVFDEILSYSCFNGANKVRKGPLINTKTKDVFIPKAKYEELVGNDKTKMVDLLVTKKMMQATSRSFIFSREMLNIYRLLKAWLYSEIENYTLLRQRILD